MKVRASTAPSQKKKSEPGDIRLHVRQKFFELVEDLVKDCVGRLVAGQALLRQVLMRFGQAFDLSKNEQNVFDAKVIIFQEIISRSFNKS